MTRTPAKFELGDSVLFSYKPGERFRIVRRDYRPHSGNWHYLLRSGKWRIEGDLSLISGEQGSMVSKEGNKDNATGG